MEIFTKTKNLMSYLNNLKNKKIGFVPTMGALHNGHISLIKKSVSENDITIVSIFVNPTQFLEGEDLNKYPKKLAADKKICQIAGVDGLFLPTEEEIYFNDECEIIAPKKTGYILEGYHRPNHFNGVLRVVLKLLNITKANNAYFGKKDAQQLYLVKKMVQNFFIKTNIVECDIIRDSDGLALSSRNTYLTTQEREKAVNLSKSLKKATKLIISGERDCNIIKQNMMELLKDIKIDYIEIVDRNFKKLEKIEAKNTIILIAGFVGTTRLIDNLEI